MTETHKEAAKRLAGPMLDKGFKPVALHTYTDESGGPLYWRIRCKHPDTLEKWIRPMKLNGHGYELGEPNFPNGKPLYALHRIASDPAAVVWIMEGEQKADALNKLGLIATTSGSATSADGADWQLLKGGAVRIWPDNDDPGKAYAGAVASILLDMGCTVSCIDADKLNLGKGEDVIQWLAAHPDATGADIEALPILAPRTNHENASAGDDQEKQQSQASALVQFCEQRVDLFHDENKDVFAKLKDTGEVWKIGSRAFRDWLTSGFYKTTGKSSRDQSMREALGTMEGLGRYRGELQQVFIRVGKTETHYYLDLGEPGKSRCIEIGRDGWRVKTRSPVAFVRFETMQALPEPVSGGDVALLWSLVNIPDEGRSLVLAWLLECLRPDSPFPVLELLGEQGSAKSSTQATLRRIFDPNSCDLRAAPKTPEDVFVAGGANWIVSYENISHLSAPMQDAYCVLATGGGFAKRKLYSDADEVVIRVKRPVVINGIAAAITAQDLIDRTLSIETPVIRDRREVSGLTQEFERNHARIVGGLLDIMVLALANLPDMEIPADDRPRLIEFAKLGMATVKAMGGNPATFLTQFNKHRDESISRTIDASPVATAVLAYMERNPAGITDTAEHIMRAVEQVRSPGYSDAWPRTPKGFADSLRRAAPALRQLKIECHSLPKTGGVIRWVLEPRSKSSKPSPASPACPTDQDIKTFKTSSQQVNPGAGDYVEEVI